MSSWCLFQQKLLPPNIVSSNLNWSGCQIYKWWGRNYHKNTRIKALSCQHHHDDDDSRSNKLQTKEGFEAPESNWQMMGRAAAVWAKQSNQSLGNSGRAPGVELYLPYAPQSRCWKGTKDCLCLLNQLRFLTLHIWHPIAKLWRKWQTNINIDLLQT